MKGMRYTYTYISKTKFNHETFCYYILMNKHTKMNVQVSSRNYSIITNVGHFLYNYYVHFFMYL